MDKTTFQESMLYLAAAYDVEITKQRASVYWHQLGELRDEAFKTAIDAYENFVEAHPGSPLVEEAISKIMAVASTHAEIGAWEVAESVYAGLLGSKLALRRPAQLLAQRRRQGRARQEVGRPPEGDRQGQRAL